MKKIITLLITALLPALSSMALAQVGMREINVDGLPITLVYPTDDQAVMVKFSSFEINVAMNAKPKLGNNRLIVMSHGTGGSASSDHELAAALAKAGYIVAQPLHSGDNWKDVSRAGPASWTTRPAEISKSINALAKDATFSNLFDVSKVGVHGMSAGGMTAVSVSGGQWSLLTMIKHCGKNMDEDIGFCLSGSTNDKTEQLKRRAQFLAGANAPEAFLPAELKATHGAIDNRIKATTLAVPLAATFTAASLAAINIPVGVLGASNDEWLVPKFHSEYLLANCTKCVSLSTLPNAGHMDLLSPWPQDVATSVGEKVLRGGMPNPKFEPKDRTQGFERIVQFFNQQLI